MNANGTATQARPTTAAPRQTPAARAEALAAAGLAPTVRTEAGRAATVSDVHTDADRDAHAEQVAAMHAEEAVLSRPTVKADGRVLVDGETIGKVYRFESPDGTEVAWSPSAADGRPVPGVYRTRRQAVEVLLHAVAPGAPAPRPDVKVERDGTVYVDGVAAGRVTRRVPRGEHRGRYQAISADARQVYGFHNTRAAALAAIVEAARAN